MKDMELSAIPVAKAEMLIRKPVADVFQAFVDPAITTKFWFTKGSETLEAGRRVRWDWEMYGVGADVTVKAVEANKRILVEWSAYGGPTAIEWTFTPRADGTTFVSIQNTGFTGKADDIVSQAIGSTEGFALVLAGAKAFLEHNLQLNLVGDRMPKDVEPA